MAQQGLHQTGGEANSGLHLSEEQHDAAFEYIGCHMNSGCTVTSQKM